MLIKYLFFFLNGETMTTIKILEIAADLSSNVWQ